MDRARLLSGATTTLRGASPTSTGWDPPPTAAAPGFRGHTGTAMAVCLFCGSDQPPTVEHVVPVWAREAFDVHGGLTLWATERVENRPRRRVAGRPSLTVTLNGSICAACNSGFLSRLENTVGVVLTPMMVGAAPVVLDGPLQRALSTWAVKTAFLMELAWRQHYPARWVTPGYVATETELAWLWAKKEPPPRSLVWLGCWDCKKEFPVTYEPSVTALPTTDRQPVTGHFTTMAIGYVVFQVFTVDYVAADRHGAGLWNTRPPSSLEHSLTRIWPALSRVVNWPTERFEYDEWPRLVSWDGALHATAPGLA